MDIKEKQARWALEKPLFEAEFIHSHLLPFFTFNENTGDYEIKSECVNNTDDEDRKVAYEALNTGWVMWLRAKRDAKTQAVPEKTVKLHLVWNENKDECVGFLDSKDARYTATGDDRGMFGVTALGDYFRDLNDEHNEFETQIVMIEAQEPAND